MNARTLFLALAIAAASHVIAKEPLAITVSPVTSFAPANLVIRASLEPDAENRAMEVVADSEDFYRSSTIPLDGDRAPKTSRFELRDLPSGEYEVQARVIAANGKPRALARTHVVVVESAVSR